jgi:hypothetical protein
MTIESDVTSVAWSRPAMGPPRTGYDGSMTTVTCARGTAPPVEPFPPVEPDPLPPDPPPMPEPPIPQPPVEPQPLPEPAPVYRSAGR